MNRNVLPSFSVSVIRSKLPCASCAPGSWNREWLVKFNDSARRSGVLSLPRGHDFDRAILTFVIPSRRKVLRPRFPRWSVGLMNENALAGSRSNVPVRSDLHDRSVALGPVDITELGPVRAGQDRERHLGCENHYRTQLPASEHGPERSGLPGQRRCLVAEVEQHCVGLVEATHSSEFGMHGELLLALG